MYLSLQFQQVLFKQPERTLEAHNVCHTTSKLLYIWDPLTKKNFLIDTGAEVSILPATNSQKNLPPLMNLHAANATEIAVYKRQTVKLSLNLQRTFDWTFYVAEVSQPILGADFLTHFNLIVDVKNRKLYDSSRLRSTKTKDAPGSSTMISTIKADNPYASLLKSFPELTQPYSAAIPVKHQVTHHIETTGRPTHAKSRRLAPDRYCMAKTEFELLLQQGIIRPSSSNWSSALHIVSKNNGEIRPCGDYRALNAQTVMDRYPIPNIQEFTSQLNGCKIFSKIDLVKAFHQIPVNPADVPKTAVITPFGLYEYVRMPFGLRNAAQTFQRFIDEVLRGLPFVFAYIDDLLIASPDEATHRIHLKQVLLRLQDYGIQINADKSEFGATSLAFLGHVVSSAGITPLPSKSAAIQEFPKPNTQRQLKEFLGMINYYNRFIPKCSLLLQPLYNIIRPAKRGQSITLNWNPAADNAFEAAKTALAQVTMLCFPSPDAETSISTDASSIGTGGVLQQRMDGAWKPIAFFSKKLSKAEKNYSTFDRELLAIYKAIKRFRYFIEGRSFHVYSDHKPLSTLFKTNKSSYTPRQLRHIDFISQFTTDIRYIKGVDNTPADALSRNISSVTSSLLDYAAIATEQADDSELQQLLQNPSLKMEEIQVPGTEVHLYADVSTDNIRPYLPKRHRQPVFNQLHGLSHPGIRASQHMMTSKFLWPGINKDVRTWTRACLQCQTSKINRHTVSPTTPFKPVSARFEHIHIDLVGPLPYSQGFKYLLTCIDRFTRWPEAIPIPDINTKTVAKAFLEGWISRFGVPLSLTSDRGSQFESHLWDKIMTLLGIRRQRTTSYHPQANGLVERFHRQLKSSLTAQGHNDWMTTLPLVLLGIRTSLKTDIGNSSAELVYGSTLRLPGEFLCTTPENPATSVQDFATNLKQVMSNLQPVQPRQANSQKTFVSQDLSSCTHVFVRVDSVRKPLQPPYEGPFEVVRRTRKTVTINRNNSPDVISIDRVKPAYMMQPQDLMPTTRKPKKTVSFLLPRH